MILTLMRWLSSRKLASTRSTPNQFRPELFVLEGRITPADTIWIGNGMGNGALWSVGANWNNGVPGANDTAIFDAQVGGNTNSTMDLGGAGAAHVGKIVLENGYNKTITLNSDLWADILIMKSPATITGAAGKKLVINQTTNGNIKATLFGASLWERGTLSVSGGVTLRGEQLHPATLVIDTIGLSNLNCDLTINDKHTTAKWTGGNFNVANGVTVNNYGTFEADPGGAFQMGALGAEDIWYFKNRGKLVVGSGKFTKAVVQNLDNGAEFQKKPKPPMDDPSDDQFDIDGEFIQSAVASVSVESGTLYITGTFTQSDGSVTVADGTVMEVTGTYALSGGTVAVNGSGAALSVGTFEQTGGTTTVTSGLLDSANTLSLGGTLALLGGTIHSAANVEVLAGGTLFGFGMIDVSSGAFVNAGTVTVGDSVALIGTLTVLGNYTQTTGVLNLKLLNPNFHDQLTVFGLATLGGTLTAIFVPGAPPPAPGSAFDVVNYGSRSGTFATVNLPPLPPPRNWDTRYDHPLYPTALSIWVG